MSLLFRTRVNGRIVTERVQIKHGARILMGNNHLYRLSCPKRGGEDNNENEEPVMNYEQAMKEISVNELAAGGWSQTCLNNVLITIVYRSYLCNNAEKITRKTSN